MARICFEGQIKKMGKKGEKTGWIFLDISAKDALRLNASVKGIYQVCGTIDHLPIYQVSIFPMGDGHFILPINAGMRQKLKKRVGATIVAELDVDNSPYVFNVDFQSCLNDNALALEFFESLAPSNRKYFDKYISSAKTDSTKVRRLAMVLEALEKKMDYGAMIRRNKKE